MTRHHAVALLAVACLVAAVVLGVHAALGGLDGMAPIGGTR